MQDPESRNQDNLQVLRDRMMEDTSTSKVGTSLKKPDMMNVLEETALLELGAVDTNDLLTLLECPVCLDHITPPVKQCVKGHLVCADCFPRLAHCPTCRSAMSTERNLAMEQVSRLLNFPCRYHPMGCKISAPLSKKAEHERNCDFLQLKCPFHGQCSFSGSLNMVVPHLKGEHQVTPVPVQPNGTLFYRAKQFAKRNLWAFIYNWDGNMFRFLVKHLHASSVGRTDNCNLVIAHVQYIGPDSMAAQYAYQISLFDAERRQNGPKFEGVVSSTMKPLESQVSKDEVFVATTYTAREFTDQFGQLNFIITMRSLKEREYRKRDSSGRRHRTSRTATSHSIPVAGQPGPSNIAGQAGPSGLVAGQPGPSSAAPAPTPSPAALPVASTSATTSGQVVAGPSSAAGQLVALQQQEPISGASSAPTGVPSGSAPGPSSSFAIAAATPSTSSVTVSSAADGLSSSLAPAPATSSGETTATTTTTDSNRTSQSDTSVSN